MKVIAYIRVSTVAQSRGHGLVRQKDGCIRWCEENGISPDDVMWVTDVCSAYKEDHLKSSSKNPFVGNLGRLIDGLNDGSISSPDYFIFEAWDRVCRSTPSVQLMLQRALGKSKMISLYDDTSPMDIASVNAMVIHKELLASGFYEKFGL